MWIFCDSLSAPQPFPNSKRLARRLKVVNPHDLHPLGHGVESGGNARRMLLLQIAAGRYLLKRALARYARQERYAETMKQADALQKAPIMAGGLAEADARIGD